MNLGSHSVIKTEVDSRCEVIHCIVIRRISLRTLEDRTEVNRLLDQLEIPAMPEKRNVKEPNKLLSGKH